MPRKMQINSHSQKNLTFKGLNRSIERQGKRNTNTTFRFPSLPMEEGIGPLSLLFSKNLEKVDFSQGIFSRRSDLQFLQVGHVVEKVWYFPFQLIASQRSVPPS